MSDELCDLSVPNQRKWSGWDAILWKFWPERWGGGVLRLIEFKDAWIVYNRERIVTTAKDAAIPADLLGGVAYAEVGGMPDFVKRDVMLPLRQFDWSGPGWVDRHLTVTKAPALTSVGSLAIQLGEAVRYTSLSSRMTDAQQSALARCLETDAFNLKIVAAHLRALILHDYPEANTTTLSEEQFVVAGSRYNRGVARDLKDFLQSMSDPPGSSTRSYTEYGRAMVRHRAHVRALLKLAPL